MKLTEQQLRAVDERVATTDSQLHATMDYEQRYLFAAAAARRMCYEKRCGQVESVLFFLAGFTFMFFLGWQLLHSEWCRYVVIINGGVLSEVLWLLWGFYRAKGNGESEVMLEVARKALRGSYIASSVTTIAHGAA